MHVVRIIIEISGTETSVTMPPPAGTEAMAPPSSLGASEAWTPGASGAQDAGPAPAQAGPGAGIPSLPQGTMEGAMPGAEVSDLSAGAAPNADFGSPTTPMR
jgi:hypothetical protein